MRWSRGCIFGVSLVAVLGCGGGSTSTPPATTPASPAPAASRPSPPPAGSASNKVAARPPAASDRAAATPDPKPAAAAEKTEPAPTAENAPAETAPVVQLSADWAKLVRVDDLTNELSDSAKRLEANLKKQPDFDKYIKAINSEAHLTAMLAALVAAHPDAGGWKGSAAEIEASALELAHSAETKGARTFRAAQEFQKKIAERIGQGASGAAAEPAASAEPTDWAALGKLADAMKQVDRSYKFIRGSMSNAKAFQDKADGVRHEAAMLLTIAEIAPAFRAEKDFAELSAGMHDAARSEIEAVDSGDFDKAKQANTAINTSCQNCHNRYRLDQGKAGDFNF